MGFASLMVQIDPARPAADVLAVAAALAARHGARVRGLCASTALAVAYGDAYVTADIIEQQRKTADAEAKAAEATFRAALRECGQEISWRPVTITGKPSAVVANEMRAADLLLVAAPGGGALELGHRLAIDDLVMRAGRPVLLVPDGLGDAAFDDILIAWRDTREARRAVLDAMPFLEKANSVTVLEIATAEGAGPARQRVADVAAWLATHGVPAKPLVDVCDGNEAERLYAIAQELPADLLVAGAYGHSRFQEWVLGGVTRDLLLRPACLTLVSH